MCRSCTPSVHAHSVHPQRCNISDATVVGRSLSCRWSASDSVGWWFLYWVHRAQAGSSSTLVRAVD
jgi:hypothetical protein